MPTHALVTGPIQGRIQHGDGWVDVTPDVLHFDSPEEAQAVADAIEAEHVARGTHPVQQECSTLSEHGHADPQVIKAHQDAHKALNKKAGL